MTNTNTERNVNNRIFNKRALSMAVAAAIAGTTAYATGGNNQFVFSSNSTSDGGGASSFQANVTIRSGDMTISNGVITAGYDKGNATTDYLLGANTTLTFGNNMTVMYGNVDAHVKPEDITLTNGSKLAPNVVVAGNLTMLGNVGSSNTTGNWTIDSGNTLTIASNGSSRTFNTSNISIEQHSTLNLGNATSGYNRESGDSLTMTSNITMGSNSTINIGNGTTINGSIVGAKPGQGTVNIHGNFTSNGGFGVGTSASGKNAIGTSLAQVNIIKGNTFSLFHNVNATNMDINGTLSSFGGNITAAITMGASGTLNLYSNQTTGSGSKDNSANVTGAIQSGTIDTAQGTVNINGTWTTQGQIGQGGRGLAAINIDVSNNPTADIVTFNHSVNATTISLGTTKAQNNATIKLQGASTRELEITGSFAGSGNSSARGNLLVAGNTTITGSIGTSSTLKLSNITIEDGTVLTIKGASKKIYSDNITMARAGTVTAGGIPGHNATLAFNGTGTTNVYGIITGETTAGEGLIDINTGTVTFNSPIGNSTNFISGIDIASGAEMNTYSNIFANSTLKVLGTLDIDSTSGIRLTVNDNNIDGGGLQINGTLETKGTITIAGNNTSATAGTVTSHAFNNATIKVNGSHASHVTAATAYIEIGQNNQTLIMQGATTIDLDLTNTVIVDGTTIVIIGRGSEVSNNGTLNISGNVSMTGYQMFTITTNNSTVGAFSTGYGSNVNTASLNATVNYRSSSSLGLTGNDQTVYDASKVAIAADTAVFQALAGLSTDATLKAALTTMSPATGGSAAASAAISGSSVGTANTRMAYMRQAGLGRGMNAGGAAKDESMWLQIFGANIDQDNVGGVSGYDANGQGLAFGIDGLSADGATRIGIAGSFANTDVDGKDSTTKTKTDIDTTQVMVYANKEYSDGMYLQGVASYSFNDNTGTRRILVGAVDRTASSVYDSGLFSINVEAGWPKEDGGVTITPTAGIAFSSLSSDAYTETGAGNMNLNVTPGDVNTVEGKIGVKITGKSVDSDGGIGRPEVRIGVSHNFGDDTADSTAKFTAGGATFTTTGVNTDSTKVDVGLGYAYTTPEGDTEISVNADGRHSSSYVQYGAGLTVKWKF